MSWILRMAATYLTRNATHAAKSSPVEHASSLRREANLSRPPVAIVCTSDSLFTHWSDQLSNQHDVQGDGFSLAAGKLQGERTVALRAEKALPSARHVRALWEGHRPRLVIVLGTGTSPSLPAGDMILATAVRKGDHRLELDARSPPLPHLHKTEIGDGNDLFGVVARCDGSFALLQECVELELPAILLVRITDAAEKSLEQQSAGLMRKSGRWVGKLTRRKGGISRWWHEHEHKNTAIDRQIEVATQFVLA
jgi:hypothetical protein